MFFKKKQLSTLDIRSIVLLIENYEKTNIDLALKHKEYFLADTLRQFGVKVEYGRIPCPPRNPLQNSCYSPDTDITTTPPKGE